MKKFVTVILVMTAIFASAQTASKSLVGTWHSNYGGDYGELEFMDDSTCVLKWYRMPNKVLFDKAEGTYAVEKDILTVHWHSSENDYSAGEFVPWNETGHFIIKKNRLKWKSDIEKWRRKNAIPQT